MESCCTFGVSVSSDVVQHGRGVVVEGVDRTVGLSERFCLFCVAPGRFFCVCCRSLPARRQNALQEKSNRSPVLDSVPHKSQNVRSANQNCFSSFWNPEKSRVQAHLVGLSQVKLVECLSQGSLTGVNQVFTHLPAASERVQIHVVNATAHLAHFIHGQFVDDEPEAKKIK